MVAHTRSVRGGGVTAPAGHRSRSRFASIAAPLAFGAGYFVLAEASIEYLRVPELPSAALWPPIGYAVAVLMMLRVRRWIPYLAAVLCAEGAAVVLFGFSLTQVLGYGGANVAQALAGAGLVLLACGGLPRFASGRELAAFFAFGVVIGPGIGAALGAYAITAMEGGPFWSHLGQWWFGDALGVLVVTPAIVIWARRRWRPLRRAMAENLAEIAALGIGLAAVIVVVFSTPNSSSELVTWRTYLIMPFLAWAAIRFELLGATAALLFTGVTSVALTTRELGPFVLADIDIDTAILHLRLFLFVVGASTLLLGFAARLVRKETLGRATAELALGASEERFTRGFETSPLAIVVTDADGVCTRVNPSFQALVGRGAEALVGQSLFSMIHPDDAEPCGAIWRDLVSRSACTHQFERRLLSANGEDAWCLITATRLDDGDGCCVFAQMLDVTQRRRAERELRWMATHDGLTGLPNRDLFLELADQALRPGRHEKGLVAILFLDLDRFKSVNDSLGHEAGDVLLSLVAQRCGRLLRSTDRFARLSGDEFGILATDLDRPDEAVEVAERVAASLSEPFEFDDQCIYVSASVGVACAQPGEVGAARLLQQADIAMYRAKESGRARCELFGDHMRARTFERLELKNLLHRALSNEELAVHYQPIFDIEGRLHGVEALLRWHEPDRGWIPPCEFIPIAEDSGLIVGIGEWVMHRALSDLHEQLSDDDGGPWLSVNVSGRQLATPGFNHEVHRLLDEIGVDPARLCLELTETAITEEPEKVVPAMEAITRSGVTVAIDDFGTGYSSLMRLKALPVDIVKIDRLFVGGLDHDPQDTWIVAAIVNLVRALGMEAVAEGVETATQLDSLRELGCHLVQGFLLGRPVAIEEIASHPQPAMMPAG